MDLKERYLEISDFLLSYQEIWKNEIMLLYPNPLIHYPTEWIDDLLPHLNDQTLWEMTHFKGLDRLTSISLKHYFSEIQRLSHLPTSNLVQFSPTTRAWEFMTPKKQHEISHLIPLIEKIHLGHELTKIVDIGGGQGHLAQTISHHQNIKVLSLDMDQTVQNAGRVREMKKYSLNKVEYHAHKLCYPDPTFKNFLDHKTLTTGLHTCGELACAHIMNSSETRASIFNLGCCYHKMSSEFTNLSKLAQKNPLPLTHFALTLAAGPYQKVSKNDVSLRIQVKKFRYCFHMLLFDQLNIHEQVTLGNCPQELYYGDFATYAIEQFKRAKIECPMSAKDLNLYQDDSKRRGLIDQMISTGLVRDSLTRVLEVAIQLDRALWLEEQGYQSELIEVFDAKESPRNIALIGIPNR